MISSHLLLLIAFLLIAIAVFLYFSNVSDIIYLDKSGAKLFKSEQYKIRAKPDEISLDEHQVEFLVEFKSRETGVYPSDRAQIRASAIAVIESGIPIQNAYLQTANGNRHRVKLEQSVDLLYKKIEKDAYQARLAVSGREPIAKPAIYKCRNCSFRSRCPHSLV